MSIFVRWPKTIDGKFRTAYLEQTGEKPSHNPATDGENFEFGSWRLTQDNINALENLFPEVSFSPDPTIEMISEPGGA